MQLINVRFKKLRPGAITPQYQFEGDAGFDFAALIDQDTPHAESFISLDLVTKSPLAELVYHVVIPPGEQRIIPTGLAVAVPHGYELQIRPRSGLAAKKSITITNSPGTVDCVPKGTKIKTVAGEINIEDLFSMQKRPSIYSFNEDIQKIEEDTIGDMWIVDNIELLQIETEDGKKVKLPYSKEVFTKNGWKRADRLTETDEILSFGYHNKN